MKLKPLTHQKPWTRRHAVQTRFTAGLYADLKIIAEAWECTPAEVVWVVIATWIAGRRGRNVMNLPYAKSSRRLLARAHALEVKCEKQSGEDPDGVEPDEGPGSRLRRDLLGDDWENREGGPTDSVEESDEPGVQLRALAD